ncbi:MAG: arsenosugar biosynthesis radical SAM protein ArsS [Cyclobacteriaceae bacterium]|nr:arsenosugar biosynthesis radical SAM protein ArsS [Cyclobacteriaceae bacterium]
MQSLQKLKSRLSNAETQVEILSDSRSIGIPDFTRKLADTGLFPLPPTNIDILQVNVGKMCNQVCRHCHVDAGPDRKEIMTKETMQYCLDSLTNSNISIVDITGGAPEMNPDFRWFVEEISSLGKQIIVRSNLTILLANSKFHDLPEFYKRHKVNVVSSLPHFSARRTDAQRGEGVFDKSISALKLLNEVGYANEDSDLILDLVFNPSGAILPGDQASLEQEFKIRLKKSYDIRFNNLFTITNLPISRFLDYLIASNNYEEYMQELVHAYNPVAAEGVMCRNIISVGWDGYLYDCDFNQMLELKLKTAPQHIKDFDYKRISDREIVLGQHCYGCTAGAGSSCGDKGI